jgi:hypothetical protein
LAGWDREILAIELQAIDVVLSDAAEAQGEPSGRDDETSPLPTVPPVRSH